MNSSSIIILYNIAFTLTLEIYINLIIQIHIT